MISYDDLMNKKAYIFDLDGTLIDSMWIWDNLLIDFLARYGYETPDELIAQVKYMSLVQSSRYVCRLYDLSLTPDEVCRAWNDMVYDAYTNKIKLKDGVEKFLRRLKAMGKSLAIATANNKEMTENCLKNNGVLDLFDVLVYADEVEAGKSSPKIYEETLKRLGCLSSDAVLFEDILKAIETSKQIGLNVVAVRDEASINERDAMTKIADLYIESFTRL